MGVHRVVRNAGSRVIEPVDTLYLKFDVFSLQLPKYIVYNSTQQQQSELVGVNIPSTHNCRPFYFTLSVLEH